MHYSYTNCRHVNLTQQRQQVSNRHIVSTVGPYILLDTMPFFLLRREVPVLLALTQSVYALSDKWNTEVNRYDSLFVLDVHTSLSLRWKRRHYDVTDYFLSSKSALAPPLSEQARNTIHVCRMVSQFVVQPFPTISLILLGYFRPSNIFATATDTITQLAIYSSVVT